MVRYGGAQSRVGPRAAVWAAVVLLVSGLSLHLISSAPTRRESGVPHPGPSDSTLSGGTTVVVAYSSVTLPVVDGSIRVKPCQRSDAEFVRDAESSTVEVFRRLNGSSLAESCDQVVIVRRISFGGQAVAALAVPTARCVLLAAGPQPGWGYTRRWQTEALCQEVTRLKFLAGPNELTSIGGPPWSGRESVGPAEPAMGGAGIWRSVDHRLGYLSQFASTSLLADVCSMVSAVIVRPDDLARVCYEHPSIWEKRREIEARLTRLLVTLPETGTDEIPR